MSRPTLRAVFLLGLSPSRRLRRLWAGLVRAARDEAWGRGVFLDARRASYRDRPADLPAAPLLVGHSFGGSKAVSLARHSPEPVRHLLLLDPVPRKGWGICDRKSFRLPPNVVSAACFLRRRPWGLPPFSHPIRRAAGAYENHRLGLDHDGVAGRAEVERHLRGVVADLCTELR